MFALRNVSTKVAVRQLSTKVFPGAFLPAEQVHQRVVQVVQTVKFAPKTVTSSTEFTKDCQFDSLLRQDLHNKLSAEFCVPVPTEVADKFQNVKQVVDFFATHPKAR